MTGSRVWLTAAFLGIFTFLIIASATWENSPAWDEPEHILAGYSYLRYGVFLLNPFHPPLTKDLSGLAVMLLDPPLLSGWPKAPKAEMIQELFSTTDAQTLVRVARLPHIMLASGFLCLYFLSIRERHGYTAGLLAASLLVLSPAFMAHAGLVHNDVAASIFIYLSLWLLAGYLSHPPCWRRLLAFALVAGVAQVVKFSCLVLYPIYLLAIAWPIGANRQELRQRWLGVSVTALIGLGVVWAVYIVHPAPSQFMRMYRKNVLLGHRNAVVKVLERTDDIPYLRRLGWYATGLLAQGRHLAKGHEYPVFLGGKLHPYGSRLYFPVVWGLKTPLAIWLLLGLSLAGMRRVWDKESQLYLIFGASYLVVAMTGSLNLGLRHLLPLFPLVYSIAGRALAEGLRSLASRAYRLGVGVGLAGGLATLLLAWPNYLSYYNLLAGSSVPAVDSDYDWGTDLLRLAREAKDRDWTPMTVHYFGNLHPRVYLGPGTELLDPAKLPGSGWVAISATHYLALQARSRARARAKAGSDSLWDWIQSLEAAGQVGAFYIFRVPPKRLKPAESPTVFERKAPWPSVSGTSKAIRLDRGLACTEGNHPFLS